MYFSLLRYTVFSNHGSSYHGLPVPNCHSCFFPTNKTLPYRQQDVRARGQRGPPLPFYQCSAKQGRICGPPIRETEGQISLGISRIFLPDTSRMGESSFIAVCFASGFGSGHCHLKKCC